MASPAHKPRKRKKGDSGILANPRHGTVLVDPEDNVAKPAFPLVAFLWPAKGTVSQWVVLPLVLIVVGIFRWATAFWGYSGSCAPHPDSGSVLTVQRLPEAADAWGL